MSQNNENKNKNPSGRNDENINITPPIVPFLSIACLILLGITCYLGFFNTPPSTEYNLKYLYQVNQETRKTINHYKDILNGKIK